MAMPAVRRGLRTSTTSSKIFELSARRDGEPAAIDGLAAGPAGVKIVG
jgi:hypothetical protein